MKDPFKNIKIKNIKEKAEKFMSEHSDGWLGKIGSYFDPEPQKEKVLRHEDFNAAGDVYYADVSVAYKIAERVFWLMFVFFLVFSISLNYKDITYDNFYYLFKDFSSAVDAGASDYETLSYDSDSRQSFQLYRGGLATVSPSATSIYTATGRRTIRENIAYSAPFMVCSDKYVLIYDSSGNSFSIYNSFSRIFTETLEYPITDACFAEDGRFAIATRDHDSKSVIYIYDKDFRVLAKYGLDEYIFDVSIDSDNNRISMLYYDAGNGTGRTMFMVRDLNNIKKEISTMHFDGEFPLGIKSFEKGKIGVITDYAVRIFDDKLGESEMIEYFDREIIDFELSDHGIVIATAKNAKSYIIAFDNSGDLIYNNSIGFNVTEVGLFEDFVFVNTGTGVARFSIKDKEKNEFLPCDKGKLLIYDAETALVCGTSKAVYLVYGKNR